MNDGTRFELYAKELDASGDYRVLRRVPQRPLVHRPPATGERIALIVDTETTGLDLVRDEVIELAMMAVAYDKSGRLGDVIGIYNGLREPGVPIPPEVSELTGINAKMVRGHYLDLRELGSLAESAALVIAHNAAFDRPFCEKLYSGFVDKPWACSATEISWQAFGFEGTKLSYLLCQTGLFHNGHRALDDCRALLEIVARPLPGMTDTAFQKLLKSARTTRIRLWVKSPYEIRALLKARGYRWNPGGNGRPRAWWLEVVEERLEPELAYLRKEASLPRENVELEQVTAFNRYRAFTAHSPSSKLTE